jgi:hypothetical protein
MSTHHHNFDERFEFSGSAKTWSLIAILVGIVGILFGFLIDKGESAAQRTFSDLLLMGYFFTTVCVGGVFFCAYQYASQSGWSVAILRVPQAFARVVPIAGIILLAIIGLGLVTQHTIIENGKSISVPYLYAHWATHGLATPGSENFDKVIYGKSGYLNVPFFLIRIAFYITAYSVVGWLLAKYSAAEDQLGGMLNYKKSFNASIVALVFIHFTFPMFAYDAVMSLEAHWFSTMFGWYNVAGMHVSGLAAITLIVVYLKEKGYMSWVNENHLQDLGKVMFGFSIFWTYVWFGQFFLQWYANMPEESVYFFKRWEPEYKWWFWLNVVLNFCAPVLMLMSRDAKRLTGRLKLTAGLLIIGHWLDWYLQIMPGTMPPRDSWFPFGLTDVLIFIGFGGLFVFLSLTVLSKSKSLIPSKHPFVEESLHHHQ